MTKKFVHTDKEINGSKAKNEFIIPDVFNQRNALIGIETDMNYRFGKIVYTGVELNSKKVFRKLTKRKKISFFKKFRIKKTLEDYLAQVKSLKIGDTVMLSENGELIKVKS